ncbi:hypothetical protein FQZ97_1041620 [compost metagenome]
MHPGIPFAETLPAGALDQPAGGQLHLPVRLGIGHQVGMLVAQALGQLGADQRILEEAAGIAQLHRIRQLLAANGADGATDILGRRGGNPFGLQALAHRAVVQVQLRRTAEVEAHAQDQPAARLALEQAIAVGELAVGQAEFP